MTALKDRLKRQIAVAGPLSVSEYMAACLFDPEAGYYTTREPFGVSGDFTTAPEVSQMFGELIAIWLYAAWRAAGKPAPLTLAEIGPGRGTLMVDMLRTLDRLDPAFVALARIALIEASPRLTEIQKRRLETGGRAKPRWLSEIGRLDATPLFVVGNELFDALPARQFVKTPQGWRERMVAMDAGGELCFTAGAGGLDAALLPPDASDAPTGTIFEIAPARNALMEEIAARVRRDGGAGLFIDYGHEQSGLGDTLQAVRRHAYDDVLAHPGEADLTSHVDFAALADVARACGLDTRLTTQRDFLLGMGLAERAGALGAKGDEERRARLHGEVERLVGADAMGTTFKVLAIMPAGTRLPPFDTAD